MSAFKAWFHFRCGFLYLGRQQVRLMAGWLPPMGENWKEFLGLGFIPIHPWLLQAFGEKKCWMISFFVPF